LGRKRLRALRSRERGEKCSCNQNRKGADFHKIRTISFIIEFSWPNFFHSLSGKAEIFSLDVERWTFFAKSQLLMLRTHFFIICVLLGLAQFTAVSADDLNDNPLATESALPYHYPPFDKIKDEHFVP